MFKCFWQIEEGLNGESCKDLIKKYTKKPREFKISTMK